MNERTVDAYVAKLPSDQADIVQTLRRLVRAAAPKATEAYKWAQPVYEENGPFAYIKAYRDYVNFGFWRGVEVDQARGLLGQRRTEDGSHEDSQSRRHRTR